MPSSHQTSGQMKKELLEKLHLPDLDANGVKIYTNNSGGGIKYTVSHKDLHEQIPEARQLNK